MSKIIKVNPPYKALVQMPYCCGVCCFLWVLHRRGYWVDQEEIAQHCKLIIPRKVAKKFTRKMKISESNKRRGTSVEKLPIYLNRLLKKKKIPLKVERYALSKVKDPKKLIIDNLKAGNDIMVNFICKAVSRARYKGLGGHVDVVAEFDPNKEILTLGDPSQHHSKFWKVSLKRVIKGMDKKYDGHERGFYIIKKTRR